VLSAQERETGPKSREAGNESGRFDKPGPKAQKPGPNAGNLRAHGPAPPYFLIGTKVNPWALEKKRFSDFDWKSEQGDETKSDSKLGRALRSRLVRRFLADGLRNRWAPVTARIAIGPDKKKGLSRFPGVLPPKAKGHPR